MMCCDNATTTGGDADSKDVSDGAVGGEAVDPG
jgi:hypothetical protein